MIKSLFASNSISSLFPSVPQQYPLEGIINKKPIRRLLILSSSCTQLNLRGRPKVTFVRDVTQEMVSKGFAVIILWLNGLNCFKVFHIENSKTKSIEIMSHNY